MSLPAHGRSGRAGAVLLALCTCSPATGAVGAVFAQSGVDGTVRVREAPVGLAAQRAGVAAGDELLLVDGHDVRALSPQRLHELLEGPVDSTVRLTLLRSGQIERVQVVRAPIAGRSER